MATAHCSVYFLLTPSSTRRTIIVSSIHSTRPSKITHRKNYLRPKILKILPLLPQQHAPQSPEEDNLAVQIPSDDTHGENIAAAAGEEADKLEELQVSEATAEGELGGVSGNVSATSSIFKFGGVFLVGAFVFHTVYSVWFLGNYYSSQKHGNLEINGGKKRNLLFNGNGKTMPVTGAMVGQLEMDEKIQEIKLMAREARRVEEMAKEDEDEDEDSDFDDESAASSHRLVIEREIGARLSKLQSRINSNKDSSAALQINSLANSAAGVARDNNKNMNQGSEALMFKKKFKYKSPSTDPPKTPKGFSGTRDRLASDAKKRDSTGGDTAQDYGSDATDNAQILYEDKRVNQQDVETQESISSVPLEERGEFAHDKSKAILHNGKNLEPKTEKPDMETEAGFETKNVNDGGVQETSFGMSTLEVKHSRESRELRTQNSQGFVEVNQDTGPIFEKDDVHSINGSSIHGLAKHNSAAKGVKVKQATTKTDMWWLNLRYVLVILMQRGSNGEGPKGLYSLKFNSKEQDQSDDSYTVAFEDQADANNFCFLLESFFKDLGDFSADAVPMSIQELNEEMISRAKKVVVVKKRQLQLYAGQPLTDVEMALCSLIEQGQNMP